MRLPEKTHDRIWNNQLETHVLRILPGEYHACAEEAVVCTTLGSCVSACIRDVRRGIGGMNHYMLPGLQPGGLGAPETAGRFGTHAMDHLIGEILRLGGDCDDLEIKLFGGGCIINGTADVGKKNIDFIRKYISDAGLQITSEDLGMSYPRKIIYFTSSGRVMVKKLRALHSRSVAAQEQEIRDAADVAAPRHALAT